MGQVVIQDTHTSHVLVYHDSLGFLDHLLHVETLLLSGISREDSELVELDAVLEGQPGTHAKVLVRLVIHANPRILGVHFKHVHVPLCLRLADNEATQNSSYAFWASATVKLHLVLRVFLILRSFFLHSSFLDSVLLSGNLSSGCISLLTATKTSKAF
jgi:hypothetical protein